MYASFPTASAMLACVGGVAAAGSGDAAVYRDGDSWWVRIPGSPALARALCETFGGVPHRGAGDPAGLEPVPLREAVRAGGLHEVARAGLTSAAVVLPGVVAGEAIRRALDFKVDVRYRMVRLVPFDDHRGADETWLVELALRADEPIPAALLYALERTPMAVVCRVTGPEGTVLIQHGLASHLPDDQIAALAGDPGWVLAGPAFGSRRIAAAGEYLPAAGLARLAAGYPIEEQLPLGDTGRPRPADLRLVPVRDPGRQVDAVVLDNQDLPLVPLLLERHPLAETAVLVPGRDRHLLLAPGGVLTSLPVGEPLWCIGPGPLYLPTGATLSPYLPAAARAALLGADQHSAVVLLADRALRFSLDLRRPVWTLWAGPPPPVESQLPEDAARRLRELTVHPPGPAAPEPGAEAWEAQALAAELAGDLVRAAELHAAHGGHLRAARLYERAAHNLAPQRSEP